MVFFSCKNWLGIALVLFPAVLSAQKVQTVDRGGSITFKAPKGYNVYQWQVSSDGKNYLDLPNASGQDMQIAVYTPGYYRVTGSKKNGSDKVLQQTQVKLSPITYSANVSQVSAGHGYIESLDKHPGANGINIPEEVRGGENGLLVTRKLTDWESPSAMAVYYFNQPKDVVDTKMVLTVKQGKNVKLHLTVWDPMKMEKPVAESYLAFTGKGRPDTLNVMGMAFPANQYYRYQFQCLEGNRDILNIDRFLFYSHSGEKSFSPAYLSSPSVHLHSWRTTKPGAPTGNAYDWCYQEVMMPKESNIVGTYVMSLGVLSGYMGIQMNGWKNGKPLHEVIFSMWDKGSTDEDPNLPDYLRATALDHSDITTIKRFGGEGTGVQSFCRGNHWDCGKYVQFITNCRPETATYKTIENGKEVIKTQHNMLVSAWFNAQDGKGWQYISTLRLPKNTTFFSSWYSFLENYNWTTGQALRKGYYKNGYARAKDSDTWYHFNSVGFGNTDGGKNVGARHDWGQGVAVNEPGAFFMTTGGYGTTDKRASSVSLNVKDTPVDTINIAILEARVDQAIENERKSLKQAVNTVKSKNIQADKRSLKRKK